MKVNNFRYDINGLRALAVISVVAYHFSGQFLPGGFVGVDVFFVISGFLMTSIIFRGISNNNFSVFDFLKARAKRIVPALTFVVGLVLIGGYLCFDAMSYKIAGDHAFSSLLFYSNYFYEAEAGYFDAESKAKVLLHTWSLSVEWQFYIIYPIVLFFLSKVISLKYLKLFVLVLAIASLTYCVYITKVNPISSYFMIYSRAWEMMLGGIAFLYPLNVNENKRRYIEFIGLALIVVSMMVIDDKTPWPGKMALIPVFGAYLVILAKSNNTILSGELINRLGLWSYSIYLIHWPALVFSHKMNMSLPFIWYFSFVLIFSFITYEIIEKRRSYGWGAVFVFIMAVAASWYVGIDGVADRIKNQEYKISKPQFRAKYEGHLGIHSTEEVKYFNSNENNFEYILIGDSHARHYYAYIQDSGAKVASFAVDGCEVTKHFMSPIGWSEKTRSMCASRYKKVVDFINSHPGKPVIWSMLWRGGVIGEPINDGESNPNDIISEMTFFLEDIKGSGSSLFIIGDTQGSDRIMFECLAGQDLPINKILNRCETTQKEKKFPISERFKAFASKHDNVHFIDPTPALCSNGECVIVDDGMPVYTDNDHFTKQWSVNVGGYIFKRISEILSMR
ncbi:acyltransferase family protein [Citrobacter amalonaticus]